MEFVQFKNPFVRKWAEDYEGNELNAHFSKLIIPMIPEFFDYTNVFLYGGSGTGKTMLFRYLSFDVQKSYFESEKDEISNICDFFEFSSEKIKNILGRKVQYFGIYRRLTEIPSSLFKNKCKTKQEEQNLFNFYLDLEISTKLITSITELIENYNNVSKKEEIKLKILSCVKKCSDISASAVFSDISEYLTNKKKQIDLYLGSLRINESVIFSEKFREPIMGGFFRLFFNLAEVLRTTVEEFNGVKIYILLDEYERIEEHYKILINKIIRERNKFLEFKISSRRYGLSTLETTNPNDFIIIGRDAELIDLEYVFRYKNKVKYKKLLADVAEKRLEVEPFFIDKKLTNIKKLLKSITSEEEVNSFTAEKEFKLKHRKRFENFLVSHNVIDMNKTMNLVKCDENFLIEKLNMLLIKRRIIYQRKGAKRKRLYSDEEISKMARNFIKNPSQKTSYFYLYNKNKIALLFQLLSEYRKRKIYAGFDTFASLSGGFVAWFLELCYSALEFAKDKGFFQNSVEIDVDSQRRAAEKTAWDVLNKMVKNIEKVGIDIYYFSLNIGAFFRTLHLDDLVKEPEPTYFNTQTGRLSDNSKMIIEKAHQWSVLQSKVPMMPKTTGEPLPDVHILHPILAPAFQISYRTRGRTHLSQEDVELLIRGSEKEVKNLIAKYREKFIVQINMRKGRIGKKESNNQMELF